MELRRGDIYYADLNPVIGSEQGGTRPVLILQNDIGNRYSPTTIIAAITSRIRKAKLPTHVELPTEQSRLPQDSVALLEQLRTIDRQRLTEKISHLDSSIMEQVDKALEISLGLTEI
ncbi:MAG TPA: type II toxin-antitoxin system PemK/MazF family toxin [Firmicutes bacterium]|jgi:mRNA interferase MazF|nr:type II toxin-antitoxin system PemK/MazF family toxin [Bacillota bacterium]